jgi:hypothetical protein
MSSTDMLVATQISLQTDSQERLFSGTVSLKPRNNAADGAPRLSDLATEIEKLLRGKGVEDVDRLRFELPVHTMFEFTELDKKRCRDAGLANPQCRVDGIWGWGETYGGYCLHTVGLRDDAVLYVDGIGDDMRLYQCSGKRYTHLSTNVELPWFVALEGHEVIRVTQKIKDESPDITFEVRTLTGSEICFRAKPSTPFDLVKQAIYDRFQSDQLRVTFKGEAIGNGCTLSDCNIETGAVLHLYNDMCGGMYHETSSRADFNALMAEFWSFNIVRCHPSTGAVATERLTLPRGTLFTDFMDTIRALPLPQAQALAEEKPIATVAAVSSFDASDGNSIVAAASVAEAGDDVGALERKLPL